MSERDKIRTTDDLTEDDVAAVDAERGTASPRDVGDEPGALDRRLRDGDAGTGDMLGGLGAGAGDRIGGPDATGSTQG